MSLLIIFLEVNYLVLLRICVHVLWLLMLNWMTLRKIVIYGRSLVINKMSFENLTFHDLKITST